MTNNYDIVVREILNCDKLTTEEKLAAIRELGGMPIDDSSNSPDMCAAKAYEKPTGFDYDDCDDDDDDEYHRDFNDVALDIVTGIGDGVDHILDNAISGLENVFDSIFSWF